MDDFAHIRDDCQLLLRYLHAGRQEGLTGMNVLLYGPPGSGKTQLVRTLADHLALSLYEVSMQKDGGEPLQGYQRFSAYQLCQSILGRKRDCLVLFDEIEDVFPEPANFFGMTPRTDGVKAWLNRLLETNPVPTVWITNDISQLDPAYIRRFDLVMELGSPPRTWRRRIIEKHTSALPVRETWVENTADHDHLQPAHIERAARVARLVGDTQSEAVEGTLHRVLEGTFKALGTPLARSRGRNVTPYRLDVLNPDADLGRLTAGLRRNPRGRICLYGVPGSGKSAYAQYVANEVERPLLVRRASDLISKYIGETEKNTAEVFHQAEADNVVLLLDEADSFLRDRNTAGRSWEVSQVNEFLVQMEAFAGLFIASTNLMDSLDAASLRRFDLKIHFDYMRPEQAWLLFVQVMQERGCSEGAIAHDVHQKVMRLNNLTPGDFATSLRREHIMGDTFGPDTLVEALEAECSVKPDAVQRGIGFTATL